MTANLFSFISDGWIYGLVRTPPTFAAAPASATQILCNFNQSAVGPKTSATARLNIVSKNPKLEANTTMLEYALEKFPLTLKLRDQTPVIVRPFCRGDEIRLHRFLLTVPEEERLFIKQRIAERARFREWCRHPDFLENLPLLMFHESKIIAEATLRQRRGGWKRHIGVLTILTHPDYRGRDIAKLLIAEQVEIARALGLRILESELNGERKIAIRALADAGFHPLMRQPDYVLDMNAAPHDYVLMGLDLRVDEEYAGVGE